MFAAVSYLCILLGIIMQFTSYPPMVESIIVLRNCLTLKMIGKESREHVAWRAQTTAAKKATICAIM